MSVHMRVRLFRLSFHMFVFVVDTVHMHMIMFDFLMDMGVMVMFPK